MGTAAALGTADVIEMHTCVGNFLHAVHIAQGADGVGAAAGDFIILLATGLTHAIHLGVNVVIAVRVHEPDVGIHEVLQQLVALALGNAALFQNQDGHHAQLFGAGCRQHCVVGLCAAGGEHDLCALSLGVCQQELQLAHLIAAQADTGQIIAFDPHIGSQQTTNILQLLNGGGQHRKGNPGKLL